MPDDPRLSSDLPGPHTSLVSARKTFFRNLGEIHEKIQGGLSSRPEGRGIKPLLAYQKKIASAAGLSETERLSYIGMSLEETALQLHRHGRPEQEWKPALGLAMESTDMAVADTRLAGYEAFVSPIAARTLSGLRGTTRELWRIGKIEDNDIRLTLSDAAIGPVRGLKTPVFMNHVTRTFAKSFHWIGEHSNPELSPRAIIAMGRALPQPGITPPGNDAEKNDEQARLMSSIAVLSEKMALNIHDNGRSRPMVDPLLAISSISLRRSTVFRLREHDARMALGMESMTPPGRKQDILQ